MNPAETRGGQPSGDTFVNRSETAFNALREKLKSNPNLDFIEGFHIFPPISLSNHTHCTVERSLMFVSPKTPILDFDKMDFFIGDLAIELAQDPEVGLMSFRRPQTQRFIKGPGFGVGGLDRSETVSTVQTTTTYNRDDNSVLKSLPDVKSSPTEGEVTLVKETKIIIFPDWISAMEGVERYKSEDSMYGIVDAEQFKQLKMRNKKGVINHILHGSDSGKK
jgi:hypothetical protein